MKRSVYIFFLLLLGLVYTPGLTKACAEKEMTGHNTHACCRHMHHNDEAGKAAARSEKSAKNNWKPLSDAEHGCGPAAEAERGHSQAPCSDSCSHGCHCTVTGIAPLFLAKRPVVHFPAFYSHTPTLVALPLRLPAGFDFIWRPPKIG
ncbi:hypothetical protein [Arachidicoccus terrestris]|uniref:hypothetical protein n=1 Tax=Arachidicoccus terrestris TaxID=2875539 RepID=UPI001CC6238B|nr:hypothetical protein [Arachidicoccus terrestris]UAY56060.1 hypothetical protein K9M52_03255 [Arachidicoccus terrestris]